MFLDGEVYLCACLRVTQWKLAKYQVVWIFITIEDIEGIHFVSILLIGDGDYSLSRVYPRGSPCVKCPQIRANGPILWRGVWPHGCKQMQEVCSISCLFLSRNNGEPIFFIKFLTLIKDKIEYVIYIKKSTARS